MFRVGQRQIGVGPAGEARASARLGVAAAAAAAPQSNGVLRGRHAVRLRVGIRAHADRVFAVRQAQLASVGRPMVGGREGVPEAEVSQREVGTCGPGRKRRA